MIYRGVTVEREDNHFIHFEFPDGEFFQLYQKPKRVLMKSAKKYIDIFFDDKKEYKKIVKEIHPSSKKIKKLLK